MLLALRGGEPFAPPRASRALALALFHGFNALKGMRILVPCPCCRLPCICRTKAGRECLLAKLKSCSSRVLPCLSGCNKSCTHSGLARVRVHAACRYTGHSRRACRTPRVGAAILHLLHQCPSNGTCLRVQMLLAGSHLCLPGRRVPVSLAREPFAPCRARVRARRT